MIHSRRRRSGARQASPESGPAAAAPDRTSPASMLAWLRGRGRGPVPRPQYLWGVLQAAVSAQGLGVPRISAVEFGVAGGNGLLALEDVATTTEELLGVRVDVYGFDTGTGMPAPTDPRDLPWAIEPGILAMDEAALRSRLDRAELVLGPVQETVARWIAGRPAPLGFAAFDLDLYTATVAAFAAFDAEPDLLLPRVVCYFDDLFGLGWSDFAGERAAIADFNAGHPRRKIGKVHGLRYGLPAEDFHRPWVEQMYLAHVFDSPRYNVLERPVAAGWEEAHRLAPPGG